ncbi:hypothetical protein ABIE20_004871 [Pseudomonas sp. 2835]
MLAGTGLEGNRFAAQQRFAGRKLAALLREVS